MPPESDTVSPRVYFWRREMIHTDSVSGTANRPRRRRHLHPTAGLLVMGVLVTTAGPSIAQAQLRESAAKLIARTMGNPEFRPKSFRGGEWLGNGDSYLDIEPSTSGSGSDIVKY